ncbi:LamG domain-containing protein [Streptomyces sp. NPDC003943]
MAVGLVVPLPAAQAAMPAVDSPVLDEAHQALEDAKASGQRVEVQGERGERTSVFANPDGFTFTLEQHSVPIRVAKPGGGWQTPDATLEKRADGTVGPKAASAEMTFSGGADSTPLVKIADEGRSMELDWKGDLPAPELDGANAVYRNVLPDVDLKVTATVESFQQVLVVKTPEAAANPALKELTFDLKTDGLAIRKGAAGNLAAVDGNGNTVFRSPPARMWDSAGQPAAEPTAASTTDSGTAPQLVRTALAADDVQPTPGDPSEQAASGTGLAPGQGDNVSRMDVNVTHDSLSVVPDADMLTNTASDDYPLFIDPTVTWGESERTLLRSDGYESYGWGNGSDGQGQGAGKCGSWNGYYCGPGYVQKLYFEFAPDSLRGKKVLDATFRVTEPWAFQCDPRWVDLVRTNNISSSTTWSSRPTELDWLVDRYVSAGRGSLCDPNSPDAPIEFNDNPDETNENLTPTVRDFAAGKFSRLTLEIRAHDESDASAWKRFRNDAVLAVSYVALPAVPTGAAIVTGSGNICSTNHLDPDMIADPKPQLNATPQTAAGGETGAKLRAHFRVEQWTKGTDGTWAWRGTGVSRPSDPNFVGDNSKVAYKWETSLANGGIYRFAALTQAFYDNGTYSQSSGYSNWCYFDVDTETPLPPKITLTAPYDKICTSDDLTDPINCPPVGGPNRPLTFTAATADSVGSKLVQYKYAFPDENTTYTELAVGKTGDTVIPRTAGLKLLKVRGKDEVGRWSEPAIVKVNVAESEGPVGRWNFSEPDGSAAVDSGTATSAPRQNAALYGGAVRDERGRRGENWFKDANGNLLTTPEKDRGMSLSGTGAYAATPARVLDVTKSYTIASWVRLNAKPAGNVTVLSQDGSYFSSFYLSYLSSLGKWSLRTATTDVAGGNISTQIVVAKDPAPMGVWTHLAGVYDASTGQIEFYVNGRSQGTHTVVAPPVVTTSALQIGRAKYQGNYVDYFPGSVDEVSVWQEALNSDQIADEAKAVLPNGLTATELVADWKPVVGATTDLADTTSGYGRQLTLSGATVVGDALHFVGAEKDSAAAKGGPLVDETGSFTLTTEVSLDKSSVQAMSTGDMAQVFAQPSTDGSSWGLWFTVTGSVPVTDEYGVPVLDDKGNPVMQKAGLWRFGRVSADGKEGEFVESKEAASLGTSVRLTGVYDAQAAPAVLGGEPGAISLWVQIDRSAPKQFTAKTGSGDFTVGSGFANGAPLSFMTGDIHDVRLWTGAMTTAQQVEKYTSTD